MEEYKEISLGELFSCLWKKAWLIILSMVVFAAAAYAISSYVLVPQYKSSISMYVNNKSDNSTSLTSSDVTAAKSLVDTYITILESNSVLDDVAARVSFDITATEIRKMMSANSVNGTEVFKVDITGPVPEQNAEIANRLAKVAPPKISEIVDGSSVKIVDYAKKSTVPVSPNVMKNTAVAALLGLVLSCVIVIVIHMLDTTIRTEDDLREITDLPVLGIFSNFSQSGNSAGRYGAYGKYAERGDSK